MKLFKLFLVSSLAMIMASQVQARVIVNEKTEVLIDEFIPCANGGAGEFATGSVQIHTLVREVVDGRGGLHLGEHIQSQGGVLTGLVTGDEYKSTSVDQSKVNVSNGGLPVTNTFVSNFRFIGKGKAVNFMLHKVFHVTINSLGEVTAESLNSSVTCR